VVVLEPEEEVINGLYKRTPVKENGPFENPPFLSYFFYFSSTLELVEDLLKPFLCLSFWSSLTVAAAAAVEAVVPWPC